MKLTLNGKANAVISVNHDYGFAGNELQKYIKKISGATLPVTADPLPETRRNVISIGIKKHAHAAGVKVDELPEQGFAIKTHANRLVLFGNDKLSTLHSVYYFLEKHLGCAWCAPGVKSETIPAQKSIKINRINDLQAPDLKMRGMQVFMDWKANGADTLLVDWMAKNRMNLVMFPFSEAWEDVKEQALSEIKGKRGMLLEIGLHDFSYLLDPGKYFNEHPEYYSLINGKHINPMQSGSYTEGTGQICMTNKNVIRIFSDNLAAFIRKNPESDIYAIGPNDGDRFCECENCRKINMPILSSIKDSASNVYYLFCNEVVKRIGKLFPGKRFLAVGYGNVLRPPSTKNFKFHPRLDLCLALFGRFCGRPFKPIGMVQDLASTTRFDYLTYADNKQIPDILKKWRGILNGDIYSHQYYQATNGSLSLPFPIYNSISEDAQWFRELGLNGFYNQAFPPKFGTYGLNYYLAAKAYYNTRLRAKDIISIYCYNYYGNAAEDMKEYYNTLSDSASSSYITPGIHILKIFSGGVIKKCGLLLTSARKKSEDKIIRDRVNLAALSFEYACRIKKICDKYKDLYLLLSDENEDTLVKGIRRLRRDEQQFFSFVERKILGKELFHLVGHQDTKKFADELADESTNIERLKKAFPKIKANLFKAR